MTNINLLAPRDILWLDSAFTGRRTEAFFAPAEWLPGLGLVQVTVSVRHGYPQYSRVRKAGAWTYEGSAAQLAAEVRALSTEEDA